MSNRTLGYIILWQVPEVDIRYTELAELAESAGLPTSYIPKAPKPRGAWEKATNLGSTGLKVTIPPAKIAEIKQRYGKEPVCKLYTKIVSKSAPLLIRHIVREVTIAADGDSTQEKAQRQLNSQTVAILEYDCEADSTRATGPQDLPDPSGYVNGNVREVVQDLFSQIDRYMFRADGQAIAASIRQCLNDNAAVLMTAGGAYFVPYTDKIYSQELKPLKVWVEMLGDYRVDMNHRPPQVTILPLTDTDEVLDALLDIAANAETQLAQNVNDLIKDLSPLMDGNRTQKVAGNIRARVNERYAELQSNVNKYKVALNDSLPRLDALLDKAAELIRVAMAVDTYRVPRVKEEVVTVETGAIIERGQRVMTGVEVEAVEVTRRGKRVA